MVQKSRVRTRTLASLQHWTRASAKDYAAKDEVAILNPKPDVARKLLLS